MSQATSENSNQTQVTAQDAKAKAAEYRKIAAQYDGLGSEQRVNPDNVKLRKRISELCGEIVKEQLPLGVSKEKVQETLGAPIGELSDALLYSGDSIGWLHSFKFKDGKLIKHGHVFSLDLEGGK